ncbi:MAG: LacI family DNA-binding transcriptional regulator [Verrucomicrobiota bacterium]|nr:LacI family DNA-binding transcriptional regulator [Verrucomicrobiota bacterium]
MDRINHSDIAAKAGISQSTVSRALQGDPRISKTTRATIQALAEAMGYKPDPMMSRLAINRWNRKKRADGIPIAYVVEKKPGTILIGDASGDEAIMGDKASRLGYHLDCFYWPDYPKTGALQRVLLSRGIAAVILGSLYHTDYTRHIDLSRFVCLSAVPGIYRFPIESVYQDHFQMIVLCWRKAVEYGYRRIGFCHIKHVHPIMDDLIRMAAVHCCQTMLHPNLHPIPVLFYTYESSDKMYHEWMAMHRPDVVIGFNIQIYEKLIDLGYNLTADIGFVSLHRFNADRGIAGIPSLNESMGELAIDLLHRKILANQYGLPNTRIEHVVEPTWVDGSSMPNRTIPPSV